VYTESKLQIFSMKIQTDKTSKAWIVKYTEIVISSNAIIQKLIQTLDLNPSLEKVNKEHNPKLICIIQ